MKRLAELADSVREVRSGRILLLAGASAERSSLARSLAEELRYHLPDLRAVVSKYIGETEQHLTRLLAPVDNSASVLFFDEADALFGRRTAVKDAHGRYADLLHAWRSARGVVVLGVDRADLLPRELRDQAPLIPVSDYWPPR